MPADEEYLEDCLRELRCGDPGGSAFHSLLEAGPALLPRLMDSCRRETDRAVRAALVEVIWQSRRPEALAFLAEAVRDPEPAVWKAALDGLVAAGGEEAARVLASALADADDHPDPKRYRAWVQEAWEQASGGGRREWGYGRQRRVVIQQLALRNGRTRARERRRARCDKAAHCGTMVIGGVTGMSTRSMTVEVDRDLVDRLEHAVPAGERTQFVERALLQQLKARDREALRREMEECATEMYDEIMAIDADFTPLEEELHWRI